MKIEDKIKQTEEMMKSLSRDEKLEVMLTSFFESTATMIKEYQKNKIPKKYFIISFKWVIKTMVYEINDLFEGKEE